MRPFDALCWQCPAFWVPVAMNFPAYAAKYD